MLNIDALCVDWNPIKKEDINADTDTVVAYVAAKALSERAVWEWAEAHPHVDVTTSESCGLLSGRSSVLIVPVDPIYNYGPFAPLTLRLAPGDFAGLSTNLFIYNLVTPPGQHLPGLTFIDVRDAARAHVGALSNAPAVPSVRKRAILTSPHGLNEREVLDMVCQGFATKDIAAALDISARTIDAHRANIAEKLGTSSVAEFVRLTLAAPGPDVGRIT